MYGRLRDSFRRFTKTPVEKAYLVRIKCPFEDYRAYFRISGGAEHGQLLALELHQPLDERRFQPGKRYVYEWTKPNPSPSKNTNDHRGGDILVAVNGFPVAGLRLAEVTAYIDSKMLYAKEVRLEMMRKDGLPFRLQEIVHVSNPSREVRALREAVVYNIRRHNVAYIAKKGGSELSDEQAAEFREFGYRVISSKQFEDSVQKGRMIEHGMIGFYYGTRTPDELKMSPMELTDDEVEKYLATDARSSRRNSFDEAIGYVVDSDIEFSEKEENYFVGNTSTENTGLTEDNGVSGQNDERFPDQTFTILRVAGIGSTGPVYVVQRRVTSRGHPLDQFAVKKLGQPDENNERQENRLRSLEQLRSLKRHANVVQYYSIQSDQAGQHWLYMDCSEGTSLEDLLPLRGFDNSEHIRIVKQILDGLSYLHDHGIVHTDLRPKNILFTAATSEARIGGLDECTYLDSEHSNVKYASGVIEYMSPEMVQLAVLSGVAAPGSPEMAAVSSGDGHQSVGKKTDIWSFACIVLKVFQSLRLPYARPPFEKIDYDKDDSVILKDINDVLKSVKRDEPPPWMDLTKKLPQVPKEILAFSLKLDPEDRSSARELLPLLSAVKSHKEFGNTFKTFGQGMISQTFWMHLPEVSCLLAGAGALLGGGQYTT